MYAQRAVTSWPFLAFPSPSVSKLRRIIYRGGNVGLHVFVQELEDHGMRVLWRPPDEGWSGGMCPGTRQHVVEILADGTLADIGVVIDGMQRRVPRVKAELQGTDNDEDRSTRRQPAPL